MAITVYGAGAIGGTTGAALARAGHDVLLVDSHAPHVDAINAHGITIERQDGVTTTRVPAVTPDGLGRDLALVLLAVKSHHTADVLARPRAAARPGRHHRLAPERAQRGADRGRGRSGPHRGLPGELGGGLGRARPHPPRRARGLRAGRARRADHPAGARAGRPAQRRRGDAGHRQHLGLQVGEAHLRRAALRDRGRRRPRLRGGRAEPGGEGRARRRSWGRGSRSPTRRECASCAFDEFDPAWYRAALAGDVAARDRAMAAIAAHYRQHTKTKTGIWRDLAVRNARPRSTASSACSPARASRSGWRCRSPGASPS